MTTTLVEMFRARVAEHGDQPALRTKASGQWVARSWREWEETSETIAAGLLALGVRPGERVALFAHTRREWAEIDLGILLAGAVTVPLYHQTTAGNAAHILADSESTVIFAEDPMQLEKLFDPRVRDRLRQVRRVIYLDARRRLERPDALGRLEIRLDDVVPREERSRVMSLTELLEAGRKLLDREATRVHQRGEALTPDDLASVVYTSGTTGPAKGVCLTHGNFAFECATVGAQLGLTPADEQLLFLPLAHIFAKVLLVSAIRVGFTTAFATSMSSALDDALEIHPTFLGAVPRVYEKIHASVQRRLDEESPLRRRAAQMAFDVGRKVSALRQQGREPGPFLAAQHRAATLAVLERVRHRFGRRLRFAISGGAALPKPIAEFFHASDVLLLEGYGLTETTAATHINRPGAYRFGTVGRPVPGVETRIADDGEVLVRGGNVMAGYFKQPEATSTVLDADGWLHTGDVGSVDAEGYLTITDRKKDLIVTGGGKNVAPQNLEAMLRGESWISEAMVVGDGRPYVAALLTLREETARAWARAKDLAWQEILQHQEVRREIAAAVARVNADLEAFQHIKRWALLPQDFTEDNQSLTPTQKLRRKVLSERFAAEIEALYTDRA